jgi:hypothetical protein
MIEPERVFEKLPYGSSGTYRLLAREEAPFLVDFFFEGAFGATFLAEIFLAGTFLPLARFAAVFFAVTFFAGTAFLSTVFFTAAVGFFVDAVFFATTFF